MFGLPLRLDPRVPADSLDGIRKVQGRSLSVRLVASASDVSAIGPSAGSDL